MLDAHFYLHHHPCQNSLANHLITKLSKEGESSIFYQSKIIVRNQGMATWIKQRIASSDSAVAMQVEFPQPNTFLSSITNCDSITNTELLWRIYHKLPELKKIPSFSLVRNYLDEANLSRRDLKRFQLADKISFLFDKYLLYRPQWIQCWNKNEKTTDHPHEHWLARIWQEIGGANISHWTQSIQTQEKVIDESKLPQALHIFGVSNFAPIYIQFLYQLSHIIPVHIYWLNPVDGFWSDAPSNKEWILQQNFEVEVDSLTNNPLLASFGRMGREFVHNIYGGKNAEILVQEEDLPPIEQINPNNTLKSIQKSIQTNSDTAKSFLNDTSVSIHACHTPIREIECLKNFLLKKGLNLKLETSQILVICSDINTYAPAIDAVFGAHNQLSKIQLPYRICDRSSPIKNPNIAVILRLFKLRNSRFTNKEGLQILQTPSIKRFFKISNSNIEKLTSWINQSGIRWGFDETHVNSISKVSTPTYWTWESGLNRLLLGLIMPQNPDRSIIWRDIAPFHEIEGSSQDLLLALCDFIDWCKDIYQSLAKERSLYQWVETVRSWITKGFSNDDDMLPQISPLLKVLENIEEISEQNSSPLPASVFAEYLASMLESESSAYGFLSGNITFCEMKPMRSIPMDTICMVGMNYDSFPRQQNELPFDLSIKERIEGDRSAREDDVYAFLETLISAKRNLFISYIGYSIKDGSVLPPSTALQTLLDHTKGLKDQVKFEHLHSFNPSYFCHNNPSEFSQNELKAALSFQKNDNNPPFHRFEINHKSGKLNLTIDQAVYSINKPFEHFLRNSLQANQLFMDCPIEEFEPIEFNPISRWKFKDRLLKQDTLSDQAKLVMEHFSLIPPSSIGSEVMDKNSELIKQLRHELPAYKQIPLTITTNNIFIKGKVNVCTSTNEPRVVLISPSNLNASAQMKLRIYQLIYSQFMESPCSAILFTLKNQSAVSITLKPDPQFTESMHTLSELIHRSYQTPLPHFPATAEAYCSVPKENFDCSEALKLEREKKAYSMWVSSTHKVGEGDNPIAKLFFDMDHPTSKEFIKMAQILWPKIIQLRSIKKL